MENECFPEMLVVLDLVHLLFTNKLLVFAKELKIR
jgi:hypothetical protein